MENSGNPGLDQVERGQDRRDILHIDAVVASHPEIGPTPPDGGYGWLIVFSAVVYHITVPTLLSMYGLIVLKGIREEDHAEEEVIRLWDADIALVPVIMVIVRLLTESWCRAVVKTFNMPRFMGLAGLCLTVAGVLLSSYATDADSNDHIVSIFSGIFVGIGCALTGQQTDIIITHYFRDKLTMAQRLVKMAPSVGNALVPILIGYLCTIHTGDVVVLIYGAILMQNCLFLASYTRPIYIEKVIRTTYNMLRDAMEDEDEVVFSNQNRQNREQRTNSAQNPEPSANALEEDDVVVFNKSKKKNAREIVDPSVQNRQNSSNDDDRRFSSDFGVMFGDNPSSSTRFSSDFGNLDITSYVRVNGYRELEDIGEGQNPQPLYRETTVDAPSNIIFPAEITPGTARRTASLKKNLITVKNMLLDLNFYLYALLHLCTTFSILVLSVVFPPLVWILNPTLMNIWSVALLTAVGHGAALCFIMLCIILPKSINEKARLCAAFCVCGAIGFYGITLSSNKSFLVIWCMLASFATAASSILQQPLYNSTLNDFDVTATMTTSNTFVAIVLLVWTLVYNYEYKTCFFMASVLQIATAVVFFMASFRRRR